MMRLLESEFKLVSAAMLLKNSRTKSMAYSILVDGKKAKEVGLINGVSEQAAHQAAKKVFQFYLSTMECPEGWVIINLRCPPNVAKDLKKQELKMIEDFYLTNQGD